MFFKKNLLFFFLSFFLSSCFSFHSKESEDFNSAYSKKSDSHQNQKKDQMSNKEWISSDKKKNEEKKRKFSVEELRRKREMEAKALRIENRKKQKFLKKFLQSKLESFKSERNVLFLPFIHQEKESLKDIIEKIYAQALREFQSVHSFIIPKDASILESAPMFKSLSKNKNHFSSLNKEQSKDPLETKTSNFLKKDSFQEDFNQELLKNFFDKEKEEFRLKAISLHKGKEDFQAIVEGKLLDFYIQSNKRFKENVEITSLQFVCRIRIRVASPRSGRVIWIKKGEVKNEIQVRNFVESPRERLLRRYSHLTQRTLWDALGKVFPEIVVALEKLSWKGRVAEILEKKIYINAGKISGLHVGDLIQVEREGPDIFDSETGAFIGKAPGEVKGILEITRHFGRDSSVAIVHSGSDFKKNDKVEIF